MDDTLMPGNHWNVLKHDVSYGDWAQFYGAYLRWRLSPQSAQYPADIERLYRILLRMRNADARLEAQRIVCCAWHAIVDEQCVQEQF